MKFANNQIPDSRTLLVAVLPGPDRRRTDSLYQYRLAYRQTDGQADGCLMLWQVLGGREIYHVALERDDRRGLVWHCTCPDAVYRGEKVAGHVCKHVSGLRDFLPPLPGAKAQAA